MKSKKNYSEDLSIRLNSIGEEELEDVLLTFLDEVNEERLKNAEKRKKKFTELLASLGPDEAEQFLSTLAEGLAPERQSLTSSPTVGDVIQKFMDVQAVSHEELAKRLNAEVINVTGLLNESYRVSEGGMGDIAASVALKHNIQNQIFLRQIIATGYRLFAIKPSTIGYVRLAARKKA